MNHSATPWALEPKQHEVSYRYVTTTVNGIPIDIARLRLWGDARDSAVNANAQLIAAAPEMLEALKSILPFIPVTSESEGGAAKYSENVKAADKIRAAIAKAIGVQQ